MNNKPAYKSFTLWFSGSLAILGLAILNLPELEAWVSTLPDNIQGYALLAIALLNTILRYKTDTSIR